LHCTARPVRRRLRGRPPLARASAPRALLPTTAPPPPSSGRRAPTGLYSCGFARPFAGMAVACLSSRLARGGETRRMTNASRRRTACPSAGAACQSP
jgi:hypothetical protein